jgi:hypothetical protein
LQLRTMLLVLEANPERNLIERDAALDKVAVCSLKRNQSPNPCKQPRTCTICFLIPYACEAGTRNRGTGT